MTPPYLYIWQHPAWPQWALDTSALGAALDLARLEQGRLLGLLDAIGLEQAQTVRQELWVQETIATAAIEGEKLNVDSVRSSVAHRLGLSDTPGWDRPVDGLVQVMQDALTNHHQVLDVERLCCWQSALFPSGISGLMRIAVGRLRDHADAMQIVSGTRGREVVHYEAPPSHRVGMELERFLAWFETTRPPNGTPALHGIVRAALAHVWFESVHPFEDGNGRLGRALVDRALAQDLQARNPSADPALVRVFGMSYQMLQSRKTYYNELNHAQCLHGVAPNDSAIDVTPWVQWFVQAFTQACIASQMVVRHATEKAAFRFHAMQYPLNPRQYKVLERLLEAGYIGCGGGFLGGMTSEKYAKITGISKATATRDLTDLLAKGLLRVEGIGKATRYAVNVAGWGQPSL